VAILTLSKNESIDNQSFKFYKCQTQDRCFGSHDWEAKGRTNAIGALIGKRLLTVALFECNKIPNNPPIIVCILVSINKKNLSESLEYYRGESKSYI
jgi:hypothetical protein